MKSANLSLAVPPGFWRYLYDLRWLGDNTVSARYGLGPTLGTVGADGAPRGLATLTVNGTVTHFAAIRNNAGTATLVYKSTDAVTWTEITASSGQYGSTRFATDGQVFWEVAAHPSAPATDLVVMQNGADLPRVYDGTNTVIHEAVVEIRRRRASPRRDLRRLQHDLQRGQHGRLRIGNQERGAAELRMRARARRTTTSSSPPPPPSPRPTTQGWSGLRLFPVRRRTSNCSS